MGHGTRLARMHERLRERQGEPSFTWFGQSYPCTSSTYSRRTELEIGGQMVQADLTLGVRKDLFLTAADQGVTGADGSITAADNRPWPASGKMLTFCGRKLRIELVHDPMPQSNECMLLLVCVDPSK